MTIEQIANRLNEIAWQRKHPFGSLQEVRSQHMESRPRSWAPFASFSIKDDYAFHAGGRKELQFNIGYDFVQNTDVFRYGVAFSLNEDKTLHNSKAEFRPKIERFNSFFLNNPAFFSGLNMWYYSHHEFAELFENVKLIDDEMFQAENFIFIGKYFEKEIDEITDDDLETILQCFDHLMPLYEEVEFYKEKQKRVARLCWNDNGWTKPSGRKGKSNYPNSHEAKFGYGHEEWLFDTGKMIDGYHYGFLEPIRKQQQAFTAHLYDVWLYTIDGETKNRYWVGEIKNVEVLDSNEAEKIREEYQKRGWMKQMEEQVKSSGANSEGFSNWQGVELFNIRFKISDIRLNDQYVLLPVEHPVNDQPRYSFSHFKESFDVIPTTVNEFAFQSPENAIGLDSAITVDSKEHLREPKVVEITYLHKAISKSLTKKLRELYGFDNVTPEHPAGYGSSRIDIVVNSTEGLIFYEIKTYPTIRISIREALGQLLEYSMWTRNNKAKEMIIVTQNQDELEEARHYFENIRNTYKIPLYYQSYDYEKSVLSEKI